MISYTLVKLCSNLVALVHHACSLETPYLCCSLEDELFEVTMNELLIVALVGKTVAEVALN